MSPLEIMRERRAAKKQELDELLAGPTSEKRDLNSDESEKFDSLVEEIRKCDERIGELEEQEKREAAAAAARVETGHTGEQRSAAQVTDPVMYQRGDASKSFFRDLYLSRKGDRDAHERLTRHQAQVVEKRALSTTAGAGGEFAPPLWLIDEYVKFARAGRKFADSLDPMPLPSGVSSVNIPKVTGGTSTAVQASQNASVSDTDLTTGSVSSGITTVAGKQVVALQLIEQSGIPFDQVVAGDLAADHARSVDTQALLGSGSSGQLEGVYTYFAASGTVNVTYTQATPAVGGAGGFYAKLFAAASAIEGARFLPPDTVWMHPRRWNWILSSSDSQNRPLVTPNGTPVNVVGEKTGNGAEGVVGQIGGLQVITDANMKTNTGVGTNQDPVMVGVKSDLKFWESAIHADTFDAPYADSMGILFRIYSYTALIPSRYTTSVSVIDGTGLIAPTF